MVVCYILLECFIYYIYCCVDQFFVLGLYFDDQCVYFEVMYYFLGGIVVKGDVFYCIQFFCFIDFQFFKSNVVCVWVYFYDFSVVVSMGVGNWLVEVCRINFGNFIGEFVIDCCCYIYFGGVKVDCLVQLFFG